MASDEYRLPWLPVNPVPESSQTSDSALQDEHNTAEQAEPGDPTASEPADVNGIAAELAAPSATPPDGSENPRPAPYAPFGNSPVAPSPMSPMSPMSPAPAGPEAGSRTVPSAAAAFFGIQRERTAALRDPVAEVPTAPRSEGPSSVPPAPVSFQSPYLSGARPNTDHSPYQPPASTRAQDAWAPSYPLRPPVTGAVPTVRADDLTPTKPHMPHPAHTSPPSPAAEAASESASESVPESVPESDPTPTPIEAEEAEIIAPLLPPAASEIMPSAGDAELGPPDSLASAATSPNPSLEAPGATFSPAPADPVRQLGASAVSTASLQAAGAPTPAGGIVHVEGPEGAIPSFGDDEPFVPRFEPPARETPPQTPSVSFTSPTSRRLSELSSLDVPETDEPAYAPRVELSSPTGHGASAPPNPAASDSVTPGESTATPPLGSVQPPARPWAALKDDDVEFARPTILPGAGVEAAMREQGSIDPSAPLIEDPTSIWAKVETPHAPTASAQAVGDVPPGTAAGAHVAAYAHPVEPEKNADTPDDANATTGEHSVTAAGARRRGRWIWWLVLGLVIASAAGALAYRILWLPEPIALPVPTVTATAPGPTGEPVSIADSTDFLGALPDTVETNVLVAYESVDPVTEPTLPVRTAEHYTLRYGAGAGEPGFVVEAYQHYRVDDARQAYDSYAQGATDVEPVLVDGVQVGERALVKQGATGTVVWRNMTAVFVLTGPAESVLDFYEHYGV